MFCRNRALVLEALKFSCLKNCAMWVGGTPWSLRVCNIVFPSTVKMFAQFWFFYFSFLRSFLYQPAKIVYADLALPFTQDLRKVVYCQIKWAFCIFHALRSFVPENSFYSFNWVCLTTVCGNQFRRRRP